MKRGPSNGAVPGRGASITAKQAKHIYRLLVTARQIDDRASRYIRRGMGWSYHARCGGQEGIQLALGLAFRPNKDFLFPYYRDGALVLAAGMTPLELLLNGLSRATDPGSGGRHMSNHFAKPSIGIQNTSSCTGNHTLHAVGVARAIKSYKSDAVALCSQGESSVSEGYCFEAYNGADRERLPVLFVIQNNGYGISVPTSVQTANSCVADNFSGLKNLHIERCDGTDVLNSTAAIQGALAHMKSGAGPAMVHADCVRIGAHSNSDAHELYRSKKELEEVKARDPLPKFRQLVLKNKWATQRELDALDKEIERELDEAAAQAESAPTPDPATVTQFVVPPAYEPPSNQVQDVCRDAINRVSTIGGDQTEKLREAITRTLKEEFTHNPDTFLWGQDVASKDKGGVFNLTKGLLAEFGPDRVFNAPLCEDFIVGTANGMCRFDPKIRVVIEAAQFADYVWPAMEQIVEMGHEYWRTQGQFSPNVVLRLAGGGYIQGGLYHSQNVEAIMSHLPGVRVVAPSCADDAAGLLRTAIRSQGPTFFLEPKYLYNRREATGPVLGSEHAVPFGKGRVRRHGEDLTIITYGNTVPMALAVAEKLANEGHDVGVFDLRGLKPLDEEGIFACVKNTGKVLVVHEDHLFAGLGGEVVGLIMEQCFEWLDAPVRRLAARDIPVGFAKPLESAILPQSADIERSARELLAY
ncbi:MAG: thiamine pyrophosphate-dependent enzyme [Myxococcota bacterium]